MLEPLQKIVLKSKIGFVLKHGEETVGGVGSDSNPLYTVSLLASEHSLMPSAQRLCARAAAPASHYADALSHPPRLFMAGS